MGRTDGRLCAEGTGGQQGLVDPQPGGGHGLAETLLAQPGRLEVLTPTDHPDAGVTHPHQVLDGGAGAPHVVGLHGRDVVAAGVRVDGDHRHRGPGLDHGGRDDDRAVQQGAPQAAQRAPFPADGLAVGGAGEGQQLVVGVGHRPGDTLEQLGAERLELGDQHPEDAGVRAAQAAGQQAGLVAQLGDDGVHPRRGGGGHAIPAVHDLGDGRHGDAGLARDVLHPHASTGDHGAIIDGCAAGPAQGRSCRASSEGQRPERGETPGVASRSDSSIAW